MPRCSPRVSGDAEVVWLSSKRKEVAHLIPPSSLATTLTKCPLVGTETDKPDASSGLTHGFSLSTTTDAGGNACGMWLAAIDHSKIN